MTLNRAIKTHMRSSNMTNTIKALIIAAVGAAALTAQATVASAGDRSPGDTNTFTKATAAASVTKKDTVKTFIKADTHTKIRSNADFLLQK
jgi:hypothetical protein